MKVLIIDNNIDPEFWGSADLQREVRAVPGATIFVRRGPQGDLPPDPGRFDRIIVSGSRTSALADAPWVSQLIEFMRRAVDRGRPMLGVCYGHQLLARVFGGRESVALSARPEIGWARIEVTNESPLFAGLPKVFHSFASHRDEVAVAPKEFRVFARSEACGVQAMELIDGRPAYGIQFHPERDAAAAAQTFARTREEVKRREVDARSVLNPEGTAKLYDARVGEMIFRNFLTLGLTLGQGLASAGRPPK